MRNNETTSQVSLKKTNPKVCNVEEEQVLVESFSFQAPDIFTAKKYVDLIVDSEEDIELETMNETVKSPRADLSDDDLKKISDEQMLTDNVINVLQKRLKRNFTDAMGLQDTLLVQSLTCNVYQNKPFVQDIHNGRYHWLFLSTYGCQHDEIFVLDNKFNIYWLKRKIQLMFHFPNQV